MASPAPSQEVVAELEKTSAADLSTQNLVCRTGEIQRDDLRTREQNFGRPISGKDVSSNGNPVALSPGTVGTGSLREVVRVCRKSSEIVCPLCLGCFLYDLSCWECLFFLHVPHGFGKMLAWANLISGFTCL